MAAARKRELPAEVVGPRAVLLLCVLALLLIGLVMVYSAGSIADVKAGHSVVRSVQSQALYAVVGIGCALVLWKALPYRLWAGPLIWVVWGVAVAMLVLTALVGTELYGELDALGRCTATFAVVGTETMPTEERGSIGEVRPTGWKMGKYDFVDGKYLYNRCHLLGFQLTGENANVSNLITGTRYMNVEGMLPFENAVADYVHATGNHVLMRATPVFDGDDLVARGVHMMAESVEDGGDGVAFNVFVYNVQPGVVIDYRTGENMAAEDATPLPDVSGDGGDASSDGDGTGTKGSADGGTALSDSGAATEKGTTEYVLNTNSKKFHVPSCSSVDQMSAKNRQDVTDTRENIIGRGFDPCKRCNP